MDFKPIYEQSFKQEVWRREEGTTARVLCECEVLATLRQTSLGPIFWDPEDVGIQDWGKSGTLLKEQGCHHLDIRLWGTKGMSKGPRCFATERAQTQLLFYYILQSISFCLILFLEV